MQVIIPHGTNQRTLRGVRGEDDQDEEGGEQVQIGEGEETGMTYICSWAIFDFGLPLNFFNELGIQLKHYKQYDL